MTIANINVYTPQRGESTSLNRKWATKSEVAILQEQVDNLEEEIRRLKEAGKTETQYNQMWNHLGSSGVGT